MVQELGKELADDLVARHKQQDPTISGKFIRKPTGPTIRYCVNSLLVPVQVLLSLTYRPQLLDVFD